MPFDAAHAIGNITFALIAGPAMIRMLVRFRERFEWRRTPAGRRPPACSLVLALADDAARRPPPGPPAPARRPTGSPRSRTPTAASATRRATARAPTTTAWAMLGLEAAGRNPLDVSRGGSTPVDYLRSQVGALGSAGDLARTILALEGAGLDPRSFGGREPRLRAAQPAPQRRLLGRLAGDDRLRRSSRCAPRGRRRRSKSRPRWLGGVQNADGGWGYVPGAPATPTSPAPRCRRSPARRRPRKGVVVPAHASARQRRLRRSAAPARSTRSRPPGPRRG